MKSKPILFALGVSAFAAACVALFYLYAQREPVITITDRRGQTIEGFGGMGAEKAWWLEPPYFSKSYVNLLTEDLGVTILRDDVPLGFEPENDNHDPRDLNLAAFNIRGVTRFGQSTPYHHFEYLKAMHSAGVEKFIVTIMSPPLWMKHNQRTGNGRTDRTNSAPAYTDSPDSTTNQLRLDMYQEFAEHCVAYVKILKRETGIDLYAISLQNEPRFSQWYVSSVHSPSSLARLIGVVGERFEKEGIKTKIFAPEDVQSFVHMKQYMDAIMDNDKSKNHLGFFASHNYSFDGIQPSSTSVEKWRDTRALSKRYGKQLWMTETSGFKGEPWPMALRLASSMHNALTNGNVAAWVYYLMCLDLFEDGRPNALYYISKHFYKHVRPGFVRLETNGGSEKLLFSAFEGPDGDTQVFVAINTDDESAEFHLSGARAARYRAIRSTDGSYYENVEPIDAGQLVTVPALSITTFIGN